MQGKVYGTTVEYRLKMSAKSATPPERTDQLATLGSRVDTVPVRIRYKFIELFSGELYANPSKAIEELVVNAYDAFANVCHVFVPSDVMAPGAQIVVWDDGDGMDLSGFHELWLIADSHKRDPDREKKAIARGRPPIGKFGIGKLAAYSLGNRITHIAKRKGRYLAVTMNFAELIDEVPEPGKKGKAKEDDEWEPRYLPVRELTEEQASALLASLTEGRLPGGVHLPLFGPKAPAHWTLAVVDNLKDRARQLQMGRLRWIIATGLPLRPDFEVYLNGDLIESSKIEMPILKSWVIGEDDKVAEKLRYPALAEDVPGGGRRYWIELPGVGKVTGRLDVYEETLTWGKAAEHGRSHGFFLMVRGRLVNLDDSLLGVDPLSHKTFNRLHAIVYADGLDDFLVASREDVKRESLAPLTLYLRDKFTQVRTWYETWEKEREERVTFPERYRQVPGALTRYPLRHALNQMRNRKQTSLKLLRRNETGPAVEEVNRIELDHIGPEQPLAVFDSSEGAVRINADHPMAVNFPDSPDADFVAVAEVLLEAYLLDAGVADGVVGAVLDRRDDLFRALLRRRPRTAAAVARKLREAIHADKEMEEACYQAFEILGYDVTPIGGNGEPDGLAVARRAVQYATADGKELVRRGYKLTYEAKSTKHDRVRAKDIDFSAVDDHRKKWKADHAVVVAPDYEIAKEKEEATVIRRAKQIGVVLIRARDLAALVEAAATRGVSYDKLEELWTSCHSPDEVKAWIEKLVATTQPVPHLLQILKAVYSLESEEALDPPSFGAIKAELVKVDSSFATVSERDIREWMKAVERVLPELVHVSEASMEIVQKPEVIASRYQQAMSEIKIETTAAGKPKP